MAMPRKRKGVADIKLRLRLQRRDGKEKRAHLLEAAGQVFAELGYSGASNKVVCERSGQNLAMVNYYFGSKEGLYKAVLDEAFRRVAYRSEFTSVIKQAGDPRAKLAKALNVMVTTYLDNPAELWHDRVLMREMMNSQSPMPRSALRDIFKPTIQPLLELIGRILNLPPNHAFVQRAFASMFSVVAAFMLMSPLIRSSVTPAVDAHPRATSRVVVRFMMGGLEELRRAWNDRRASPGPGEEEI